VLVAGPAYARGAPATSPGRACGDHQAGSARGTDRRRGRGVAAARALIDDVPHLIVDQPIAKREWVARTWTAIAASGLAIDRPQLLVAGERNPRVQQMRLIPVQARGD
jgi:hypothetical protein